MLMGDDLIADAHVGSIVVANQEPGRPVFENAGDFIERLHLPDDVRARQGDGGVRLPG